MNDSILVRVATGDETAVDECLDQFGALVWSLARRLCRNTSEAEEAVQDIFVDLWQNAGRYDPDRSSESTFVTVLARRRLIDRHRRRSRQAPTTAITEHVSTSDHAVGHLAEVGDEAARVREHMSRLKPEERQVLELSIEEGLSQADISTRTGMPLGTVKTHARRGLHRLREFLGGDTRLRAAGGAS